MGLVLCHLRSAPQSPSTNLIKKGIKSEKVVLGQEKASDLCRLDFPLSFPFHKEREKRGRRGRQVEGRIGKL